MELKPEGEAMEPIGDTIDFLIIHFEDKDFFGASNIGRALIDLSVLLVDTENKLDPKVKTHWFPIIVA